jgi:hypothetical protein
VKLDIFKNVQNGKSEISLGKYYFLKLLVRSALNANKIIFILLLNIFSQFIKLQKVATFLLLVFATSATKVAIFIRHLI